MSWLESLKMALHPAFISLLVSAGVGLIIGLEREFNTHEHPAHIGGIRTFILVAILGNIVDWLAVHSSPEILPVMVGAFSLLIILSYFVQSQHGKLGLTTPLALFLTFLLGIANSRGFIQESLAVVILMTTVLSLKEQLHGFIRQITNDELFAFIKFIVLCLLILPMLPDESFGPDNILNLRDLGFIVILVLSLSFVGYLLLKFGSAHKGILLTAIIGGLFSSTLIAWVFSAKSRERPDLAESYGSGIVLASSIMFIRVLIWVSIFAFPLTKVMAAPMTLMFLVSLTPSWQVLKSSKKGNDAPPLSPGNPLDVKNAVLFVLLYVGITLFMAASRKWLNPAMTYISGAVSGVADIDAITISTAKWAAMAPGQEREAALIILLAVMSNSIFKYLISFFNGEKALRQPVNLGFGLVLLVGLGFMLYWIF